MKIVASRWNLQEKAKTDKKLERLAVFEKNALESKESSIGFFQYNAVNYVASYADIKTTGWTAFIMVPLHEFTALVNKMRRDMIIIGLLIILIALGIVFFDAHIIVKPVVAVAATLRNIAQGEGDLTVRLPVSGNDEVTQLSEYFNQTIEKIGSSIKEVGKGSQIMTGLGNELASNMTETASSISQISENINGVKEQTMTQASSITETASTMEQITHIIKQLNNSIETQTASVAQSSSSIEQMVSNIALITQTLKKTDDSVKQLVMTTKIR